MLYILIFLDVQMSEIYRHEGIFIGGIFWFCFGMQEEKVLVS